MKTIIEKQEDDVMERKKSAKDLEFERERAKYRHIINDLSSENRRYASIVQEQKEKMASLETTVAEQGDWINRLLNYCGLSDEEMRDIVNTEKNILTEGGGALYPFTSYEMSDEDGILLGQNEDNDSLVFADIFNTVNYKKANISILGTAGAGKTYLFNM